MNKPNILAVIGTVIFLFIAFMAFFTAQNNTQAVDLPTCQYVYAPIIVDGEAPTATIPPLPTEAGIQAAPTATIPPPPLQCNTPTPQVTVTP